MHQHKFPLSPLAAKTSGWRVKLRCYLLWSGDSANAVPPTKKLRTRVTHIWGDRRLQPNRSAMEGPRPGQTA